MQTVGDIGVGCAGIEIEEKQRQMRVKVLVTALYSFADDMVGNAAEGLQRGALAEGLGEGVVVQVETHSVDGGKLNYNVFFIVITSYFFQPFGSGLLR